LEQAGHRGHAQGYKRGLLLGVPPRKWDDVDEAQMLGESDGFLLALTTLP